jgi:hypothetical protein
MAWIVGAVCMIFVGIALVVIGFVAHMLGYAILGGPWSWLVYFCWRPYGDPGETGRLFFVRRRGVLQVATQQVRCQVADNSRRRLPPPWKAEKIAGGSVIRDANGQAIAHTV